MKRKITLTKVGQLMAIIVAILTITAYAYNFLTDRESITLEVYPYYGDFFTIDYTDYNPNFDLNGRGVVWAKYRFALVNNSKHQIVIMKENDYYKRPQLIETSTSIVNTFLEGSFGIYDDKNNNISDQPIVIDSNEVKTLWYYFPIIIPEDINSYFEQNLNAGDDVNCLDLERWAEEKFNKTFYGANLDYSDEKNLNFYKIVYETSNGNEFEYEFNVGTFYYISEKEEKTFIDQLKKIVNYSINTMKNN